MVEAKFVLPSVGCPGVEGNEFNAVCGHCGDVLGRRASFPAAHGTDHITCMHCGVTNAVRKPRRAL